MNTAILLFLNKGTRKYILIVGATLIIIVSMPFAAVFALGTHTLSFLSSSSASNDTNAGTTQTVGLYQGPIVQGDYYAWGNCTYWVFYLREQAGDPIPTNWGNAATWAINALIQGYVVDRTPAVGAIMQISDVDGGLGHVAYVTAVDPTTGAWTVSEMNVQGLDIIDLHTYPASAASGFEFIHDKKTSIGVPAL